MAASGRVGFVVDAAAYFAAFRQSVLAARRSILILGWDVDSRTRLVPDERPADGWPALLLPLLNAALARAPGLRIHVLGWDFSMIYTFEREMLPVTKFGWRGHRRLAFALDGAHPQFASHHQKVVVVDDAVAYAGGLDLTVRRWDSPEHLVEDRRRTDPAGVIYPPVHDVQMVVDGPAAAALGDLARERWRVATGEALAPPRPLPPGHDPWPPSVTPDLTGPVDVGIARTGGEIGGAAGVQEVLALNLRAIEQARHTIFVENQYLTSATVAEALARRLDDPAGPEVVLVLPRVECGWLEQSSMGILRARVLARLRQADRHRRLHIYHPVVPGLGAACVNVHSKVLIVDDRLAKVGSSNLSNRSMGLDSECDLAIEAAGAAPERAQVARAILAFRHRLVGEHLGVDPAHLAARVAATGSLVAAIEDLRGGERSLVPLDQAEAEVPALNLALLDGLWCDPERPVDADKLIDEFVPHEARWPARRALVGLAAALAALLVVAVAWRWPPLRAWFGLEPFAGWGDWLRAQPAAPAYLAIAFLVGALAFVPATLLVGMIVLVFPSWMGALLAWGTSLLAAAALHGLGRARRREVARRWGAQTMWLRGQLRRRRLLAVALSRLVPVGGFSAMSLVAGALRVPLRGYLVGSALGLLPGILGLTWLADRVLAAVRAPGPVNLLLVAVLVAGLAAALSWLGRRLSGGGGRSARSARSGLFLRGQQA